VLPCLLPLNSYNGKDRDITKGDRESVTDAGDQLNGVPGARMLLQSMIDRNGSGDGEVATLIT